MQPVAVEQHAGLGQLLAVVRHGLQHVLLRHDPRFGVLAGFDQNHESHDEISFEFVIRNYAYHG